MVYKNGIKKLPNRKNTCIVVVTYNPDKYFSENVVRYSEIVDSFIIVDNNSQEDIMRYLVDVDQIKFEIIKSDINKGIAWGLNKGISEAFNKGFDFVLTLDQDSIPLPNILELYSQVCLKCKNYALIGTAFTNQIDYAVEDVKIHKTLTVITSGTLHPKLIFLQVGSYMEELFIDSVDFEYSLRVRMNGFDVIRVTPALLLHHLGYPVQKFGIMSTNHSSTRRYYMARNHIYLIKKYFKKFPLWILKKNTFFFLSIIKIIVVETNRKEKLLCTLKGIKDGFYFR